MLRHDEWSAGSSALFLTALAAVSQGLSFCYRVALSRLVGAEVMGLYQLLMPVCSVLLSLTAVGLTAAMSNLSSQYLALGNGKGVAQTLSLIHICQADTSSSAPRCRAQRWGRSTGRCGRTR